MKYFLLVATALSLFSNHLAAAEPKPVRYADVVFFVYKSWKPTPDAQETTTRLCRKVVSMPVYSLADQATVNNIFLETCDITLDSSSGQALNATIELGGFFGWNSNQPETANTFSPIAVGTFIDDAAPKMVFQNNATGDFKHLLINMYDLNQKFEKSQRIWIGVGVVDKK
jgi:hypothetical protein